MIVQWLRESLLACVNTTQANVSSPQMRIDEQWLAVERPSFCFPSVTTRNLISEIIHGDPSNLYTSACDVISSHATSLFCCSVMLSTAVTSAIGPISPGWQCHSPFVSKLERRSIISPVLENRCQWVMVIHCGTLSRASCECLDQ